MSYDIKLQSSNEFLQTFIESIHTVMDDINEVEQLAKKLKDDDRTLTHRYRKIIEKWFYSNGGL